MKKILDWYLRVYPIRNTSIRRRITMHLLFWLTWGIFSFFAFISQISFLSKILITFSFILQNATVYYGITYFIIPKLVSAKRLPLGILFLLLLYIIFFFENLGVYTIGLKYHLFTEQSYMYEYAKNFIKNGVNGILSPSTFYYDIFETIGHTALPLLLKFSRVISDYVLKVENLSKEKTDLEIDFLRTQLNPHFLLNSLNNIYSQIIAEDKTAANSVVVLSKLMKYILYNSNVAEIDLTKEIQFLRSFVDLEKLKGSRNVKIQYSEEGDFKGYKIAPMILINYIENAFKHGGNSFDKDFLINIEIKFEAQTLYFKIENDYLEKEQKPSKEGGIGIENTRKRLQLLYPDKHSLSITKQDHRFLVEVVIELENVNNI